MSESWHDYGFGICTSNLKEEISLPGLMELISQAPELKERVNTFMNNECGGAFKDSYDLLTSYVEQYGMQYTTDNYDQKKKELEDSLDQMAEEHQMNRKDFYEKYYDMTEEDTEVFVKKQAEKLTEFSDDVSEQAQGSEKQ